MIECIKIIACVILLASITVAAVNDQRVSGTLVVSVPVQDGLVTCADKRLFNVEAGTFDDNYVKIRPVGDKALFVATSTVGFYDRKNKRLVFDVFELTGRHSSRSRFNEGREFWDGLKTEIRNELRRYFASHDFSEWPESDRSNRNLLFNLIFYSVDAGRARSHTLQVFYEKKRTPVVDINGPLTEEIRQPKLSGKGQDVMAYISRNPKIASDPSILKFDGSRFEIRLTSVNDAVAFARTLFRVANLGVPTAQVSSTFDCGMLSYRDGFRWIEGGPAKLSRAID